jgi:type IV pilus assembly protein PilV
MIRASAKERFMKDSKRFPADAVYSTQRGIVLIEALIAILLFSIGILGIVGLQATMIKGSNEGRMRADASYLAQQRIAALWAANDSDLANFVADDVDISAESGLPSATMSTVRGDPVYCPGDLNCFEVIIKWQTHDGTPHKVITETHLNPK